MPDPLAHSPDMLIVKGNTLPRLWWLTPWSTARSLASTVAALKSYADRADAALKVSQFETIDEKRKLKLARDLHIKADTYGKHKEIERLKLVILDLKNRQRNV